MKLALFSHYVTKAHEQKLESIFGKPLSEVRMLYINTPVQYKEILPDWYYESHRNWLRLFPKMKELDLAHTYTINPDYDFESYLRSFEFIFVSGGNVWLLTYWLQKTGTRDMLKQLIEAGKVVYGGESAGAVVCFNDIEILGIADKKEKAPAQVTQGLGVIDFVPIPHWDVEEFHEILEKLFHSIRKGAINWYLSMMTRPALWIT